MRLRDVNVGMKVLFEDEEATVESKDTRATYAVKIITEDGRRSWVKHSWLRKVPAKKSPEVGRAEQPKPAPTFKAGDVVDCDGPTASTPRDVCKKGRVRIDWNDGEFSVDGEWESGANNRVIEGRFMRHHVAKEEAKAASEDAITVVQAKGALAGNIRIAMARNYLHSVATMLEEKNAQYGDSASNPLRIFSKATSDEGLRVRIDDKLSRIARGNGQGNEDAIKDLIGYLALLATGGSK